MKDNSILSLSKKCDIIFGDEIISDSRIMSAFSGYIVELLNDKNKNSGFVYHTGSPIFDVLLTLYISLSCLIYDENTPQKTVDSLMWGETIIYDDGQRKMRAQFLGKNTDGSIKIIYGKKEKSTLILPPASFYKIRPYQGGATMLDGRGIRNNSASKLDFMQSVFERNKSKIAGINKKSAVIVCDRGFADSFVNELKICYDGSRSVNLTDLMPVSYYSENNEYYYRGNSGKNTSVLKFTNKVSIARNLLLTDENEQIFAVAALGSRIIKNGETELPDLIKKRSLGNCFVSLPIMEDDKNLCFLYPESAIFACTKDMLLSYCLPFNIFGKYTEELTRQTSNIIDREIRENLLEGFIETDQYKKFRSNILLIRRYSQDDDILNRFIIESHSILNYFSNIPFSLDEVECGCRNRGFLYPNIDEKMEFLENVINQYSNTITEALVEVFNSLNIIRNAIRKSNPKNQVLINLLMDALGTKKILILVPKSFYIDILKTLLPAGIACHSNLHIGTMTKLSYKDNYDVIVVTSCLGMRQFSVFSIYAAPVVECLLYPHELFGFTDQKKLFLEREKYLNNRSKLDYETEEVYSDESIEAIDSLYEQEIEKLEETSINLKLHAILHGMSNNSIAKADVIRIATTTGGETIFFTKYFTPYIFAQDLATVCESNVIDILPGDTLLFTKNSDQTKDIVEEIIKKFADSDKEIEKAFNKSKYWKVKLSEYRETRGLSFQDLSDAMKEYGKPKHPVTLRSWLNPESRIIAPREEDAFYQIALICGDEEMLRSPESFYHACNVIRSLRIRILKIIGQSIVKNYQQISDDSNFLKDIIQRELEVLSHVVQIDTIKDVTDIQVPVAYVNRPCSL